jgi:hypothetical protein
MGKRRNALTLLVGKPKENRPLRKQSVDGWIILSWILEIKFGGIG